MVKKYMDLPDCYQFLMRDVTTGLSEKDIQRCFRMSKMTTRDEIDDYKLNHQLKFVEFLEFLGRVAQLKFKYSIEPLAKKIEDLLDEIF